MWVPNVLNVWMHLWKGIAEKVFLGAVLLARFAASGRFFFGGGGNFAKVWSTKCRVFVAKCTDLHKAMLAYGKNMPKNNQFSVFCQELIKLNFTPQKICLVQQVQSLFITNSGNKVKSRVFYRQIFKGCAELSVDGSIVVCVNMERFYLQPWVMLEISLSLVTKKWETYSECPFSPTPAPLPASHSTPSPCHVQCHSGPSLFFFSLLGCVFFRPYCPLRVSKNAREIQFAPPTLVSWLFYLTSHWRI